MVFLEKVAGALGKVRSLMTKKVEAWTLALAVVVVAAVALFPLGKCTRGMIDLDTATHSSSEVENNADRYRREPGDDAVKGWPGKYELYHTSQGYTVEVYETGEETYYVFYPELWADSGHHYRWGTGYKIRLLEDSSPTLSYVDLDEGILYAHKSEVVHIRPGMYYRKLQPQVYSSGEEFLAEERSDGWWDVDSEERIDVYDFEAVACEEGDYGDRRCQDFGNQPKDDTIVKLPVGSDESYVYGETEILIPGELPSTDRPRAWFEPRELAIKESDILETNSLNTPNDVP